jgi:predicted nucleic acid-binding protein
MSGERFLVDTSFVQAVLNRSDQYHHQARKLVPRVLAATEVWITEGVLVEIGNGLSSFDRAGAARFIERTYRTPNMRVVTVDSPLLWRVGRRHASANGITAACSSPDWTAWVLTVICMKLYKLC